MSLLLGAPDTQVKENDLTTWETNKIGGSPDWFKEDTTVPCCTKCQRGMFLVTQMYCPLTDSPYHRCLHIFVCPSKQCCNDSQGWRVVRTQMSCWPDGEDALEKSMTDDWGVGQDDWGFDPNDWDADDDLDQKKGSDQAAKSAPDSASSIQIASDKLSHMTIGSSLYDTGATVPPFSVSMEQSEPSMQNAADVSVNCLPESTTGSDSRDSSADNSDMEGCEMSEHLQVEPPALGDEDVQRMIGVLALQGDSGKSHSETASQAQETRQTGEFPACYLQVFAESEIEDEMSDHVQNLLEEYKQRERKQFNAMMKEHRKGEKAKASFETENYDKTEVKHGDQQCYKFMKKLQVYPQQCIRYQRNGSPLLITKPSSAITGGKCKHCGSQRVFEVQLVPQIIPLLTLPGESESAVDFGTILVYTCSNSCWSEGDDWKEERTILQQDPDYHYFK